MKRTVFLVVCLALIAGSALADGPSIKHDKALYQLDGGWVKTIDERTSDGEEVQYLKLQRSGSVYGESGTTTYRDDMGRIYRRIHDEYIPGYNQHDRKAVYYVYQGNESRPRLWVEEASTQYDGGDADNFGTWCHYTYTDKTNHPSANVFMEVDGSTPTAVSYTSYSYLSFDSYGNWTKRKQVFYDYSMYDNGSYPASVNNQIKRLARSLTNSSLSEAQIKEIENQLIPLLKKYVKPTTSVFIRKITYWK